MNKMLFSVGFTAATILISAAANAQTDTGDRDREMQAYRAYVQTQGTAPAETGQAAMAAPVAANAPVADAPAGAITTVEKTTTTSYDVRKRKVGLVGGRPFKPRESKVDGGITKEVTVNGVETETEVVKPDPMADKKPEGPGGDYYSGKRGVKAYEPEEKKPNSNLDVHYTGSFNN